MKKCINCRRLITCKDADESIVDCKDFVPNRTEVKKDNTYNIFDYPQKEFVHTYCFQCKNKNNSDLCEIIQKLDGSFGCINYEKNHF